MTTYTYTNDQADTLRQLMVIEAAVKSVSTLIADTSEACINAIRADVTNIVNLLPSIKSVSEDALLKGRDPIKALRQDGIPAVMGNEDVAFPYCVRIVKVTGRKVIVSLEIK